MFGHDKHDDDDTEAVVNPSTTPVNEALMGVNDDNDDNNDTGAPAVAPVSNSNDEPGQDTEESAPSEPTDTLSEEHDEPTQARDDTSSNDLLDIKRHALQDLSPLISHLDQSPEERFKTTMMMIQASDNQALVADAYEAAKGISDEKVRAQALLDIVNEINYFTQSDKD